MGQPSAPPIIHVLSAVVRRKIRLNGTSFFSPMVWVRSDRAAETWHLLISGYLLSCCFSLQRSPPLSWWVTMMVSSVSWLILDCEARNDREFAWFVTVNYGCAIFVTVLAVEFICHPQCASTVLVWSLVVGQKWLINLLISGARGFANYRVGSRIHPHTFKHLSMVFYPSYRVDWHWLRWDCMDSKESSILVVIVAESWWYVIWFRVDDRLIRQTL